MIKAISSITLFFFICLVLLLVGGFFTGSHYLSHNPTFYILDKLTVYGLQFYLPFVLAYFITTELIKWPYLKCISLLTYLILTIDLFVHNQYWSRGMEIEDRALYAVFLFAPALFTGILIWIDHKLNLNKMIRLLGKKM